MKLISKFSLMLIFILLVPLVRADGIPWPRKPIVYEFSAIQEKDQIAFIEVLDKNRAVMHLYLSFVSTDADYHNITIILPFKSIPHTFYGQKMKENEFSTNYGISKIEKMVQSQSFKAMISKVLRETSTAIESYFRLVSGESFFKLVPVIYYSGRLAAPMVMVWNETRDVIPVTRYIFEGGVIDVYEVSSGQTLADFLNRQYQIELPEKVREAIDKYGSHYIGILTVNIQPPVSKGVLDSLENICPNTLREMKDYVRTHPFIKIEVPGWYRSRGVEETWFPSYYEWDPVKIEIKHMFSDFIKKCREESSKAENFIPISGEVDGYNHLCIKVKDIKAGDALSFEYRSINDTYPRVFMIGIDCPEIAGKRTYLYSGCENCRIGKYCYIGGRVYYGSYNYTFASNLAGEHEICTWPSSERGYRWFVKVSRGSVVDIERIVVEFFYGVYVKRDTDRGVELNMAFNLKDNEIFYPLGTGMAWTQPIENIKVIVKVPSNLEVSFKGFQYSGIGEGWRYYVWKYENKNPSVDIIGKVRGVSVFTMIYDRIKGAIEVANNNSGWIDALLIALIFSFAGLLTHQKIKEPKKFFISKPKKIDKSTIYTILATVLLSPLLTVWATLILIVFLRERPSKKLLKETIKLMAILFITLIVIYMVVKMASWLI
ncbi:MAG: hypothetical protein QXG91_02070 [Candidatus Aenigmatarchaeota archaeon]